MAETHCRAFKQSRAFPQHGQAVNIKSDSPHIQYLVVFLIPRPEPFSVARRTVVLCATKNSVGLGSRLPARPSSTLHSQLPQKRESLELDYSDRYADMCRTHDDDHRFHGPYMGFCTWMYTYLVGYFGTCNVVEFTEKEALDLSCYLQPCGHGDQIERTPVFYLMRTNRRPIRDL